MKTILVPTLLVWLLASCSQRENYFEKSWTNLNERVWVGGEFWANRLQDWKVQDGRLECVADNPRLLMRTVHLINCRLANEKGAFFAEVDMGPLKAVSNDDAAGGLLIGVAPELDVWGASLVQQKAGPGAGFFVGVTSTGYLFVKDMESGKELKRVEGGSSELHHLLLEVTAQDDGRYQLTFTSGGAQLSLSDLPAERLVGNIALVSHPGTGDSPGRFWFNNLEMHGSKLKQTSEYAGPIISSQYTLNNNILKLTAQMAPVGETNPRQVSLEVENEGNWQEISKTDIITPGYTATFKVTGWDSKKDIPYRVKYIYPASKNKQEKAFWEGTIRHNPIEKSEIVVAGFTGNHMVAHPGLSGTTGTFPFNNSGIWYPHADVVENVTIHQPDLLFFSGDQVYEGDSPTFPDRENYELDYLYKWYLYCLAYRNLTKDIPAISIPDDHDVSQGNLWGQGGRAVDTDNKGGYVHPAWFVKMVERTQCSNLPDPYDPTPVDQGIGVYYTSMNYGGIGFAVLEDRKFKSGCADNPFITKGRPDHVIDPEFDISKIDLPGKELLGDRQLAFLNDWATNWEDQTMKMALSQTIFANMATHHGGNLFRLIADLDSNGWPQTGRDKAIDALRKAFVFHLAGDQHLASIVHHGIDQWDDGIYSFCVPSVANFYPRAWWPESIGRNRPEGTPQNLGRHKDGFGNLVTVYGVTNPAGFTKESTNHEPLELHDKMPGYGIVRLNKPNRTITMECWPRYADPRNHEEQYEGWPKTISQFDNYGREATAWLPTLVIEGVNDPVIELVDEKNGELVYCVRIKGDTFRPKVFNQGSYTITLKDTENETSKVLKGVLSTRDEEEKLEVRF